GERRTPQWSPSRRRGPAAAVLRRFGGQRCVVGAPSQPPDQPQAQAKVHEYCSGLASRVPRGDAAGGGGAGRHRGCPGLGALDEQAPAGCGAPGRRAAPDERKRGCPRPRHGRRAAVPARRYCGPTRSCRRSGGAAGERGRPVSSSGTEFDNHLHKTCAIGK
ncbi:hypothetical protein DFJ74DRAFT_767218, partial [Hyaloraphidium curvatum]